MNFRFAPRIARLIVLGALILAWSTAVRAGIYTDPQAWAKATHQDKTPTTKTLSNDPTQRSMVFVKNNPKLPNVLLIGDSISIGYTPGVRKALAGKANVYRIPENSADTSHGLKQLDRWLDMMQWSVIHFNFGLHDLKYLDQNHKYDVEKGKVVATPEQYGKNLGELVTRLKASGAKLIFATTTPVPTKSAGRIAGGEADYNQVALKVMKEAGVEIDDLCGFIKSHLAEYQRPHNVHFTEAGYAALASQVARKIGKELGNGGVPQQPKK